MLTRVNLYHNLKFRMKVNGVRVIEGQRERRKKSEFELVMILQN